MGEKVPEQDAEGEGEAREGAGRGCTILLGLWPQRERGGPDSWVVPVFPVIHAGATDPKLMVPPCRADACTAGRAGENVSVPKESKLRKRWNVSSPVACTSATSGRGRLFVRSVHSESAHHRRRTRLQADAPRAASAVPSTAEGFRGSERLSDLMGWHSIKGGRGEISTWFRLMPKPFAPSPWLCCHSTQGQTMGHLKKKQQKNSQRRLRAIGKHRLGLADGPGPLTRP